MLCATGDSLLGNHEPQVVEHVFHPMDAFRDMWRVTKPGGALLVMTSMQPEPDAFAGWHYHNDPTHVCLFSEATFERVASTLGAGRCLFPAANVAVLEKPL